MQVIAPGLLPTRPTDRRDARHLADALRAGTLTSVSSPEAFRDWVRVRMAVQVRQRGRQRVKSMWLRWGPAYRRWFRQVTPMPPPRDQVWTECLSQLEEADTRVDRITRPRAAGWPAYRLALVMSVGTRLELRPPRRYKKAPQALRGFKFEWCAR